MEGCFLFYMATLHRRAYERYVVEASADVFTDRNSVKPAILKDLSVRGAGLVANYSLAVSTEVGLFIKATPVLKSLVYKRARVAWSKNIGKDLYSIGLDFGLSEPLNFQ